MVSRGSIPSSADTSAMVRALGVATSSRLPSGNSGAAGWPRASSTLAAYPH